MDVAAVIQAWMNVVTRPGEEVFQQEKARPSGTLGTALIAAAVIGLIAGLFFGLAQMMQMNRFLGPGMDTLGGGSIFVTAIMFVILLPVSLLISSGILHLIARVLGGDGSYSTYVWLLSTIFLPLILINSILSLIPFIGFFLGSLVGLYAIVLEIFATKVNYMLTTGKAVLVVLIPVGIAFLLGFCAAMAGAMVLAGLS
jgi:hypothetical protein